MVIEHLHCNDKAFANNVHLFLSNTVNALNTILFKWILYYVSDRTATQSSVAVTKQACGNYSYTNL